MAKLKYASFLSEIELPFYTSLASHKINHDKLDDSARRVLGLYQLQPREEPQTSCRLSLHGNALTGDEVPAGFYRAEGMIRNMNTIEDYRALDKAAVLNRAAKTIWDAINDGTIYSIPSLLASFTVLCFADLKKYKFTYLFGFPALNLETSWNLVNHEELEAGRPASVQEHNKSFLTGDESTALVDAVQTWRYAADTRQFGFFLAKKVKSQTQLGEEGDDLGEAPISPGREKVPTYSWVIGSISRFEQGFFRGVPEQDRYICFSDPSTYKAHPGWMLRNFLVLIRKKWNLKKLQVLCLRDTQSKRHEARSIVLQLEAEESAETSDETGTSTPAMPKVVGWEKNHQNKVVSKVANLGEYMDPARLADQAVDLNLKLIKWRIAPEIDLDVIKNTKCLLLGAGTLGSYVSRNLLGWGVRKVTFVDSGTVSFSNPVRQPLFDFKDCLAGGAKKAYRAAEALQEIYPGVDANGHDLMVPMAGHAMVDEAQTKADFEKLKSLIEEHDVIFLLMDTRESRWLPTVMAKATGKLVMNAALGFDTFVVMRHGVKDASNPGTEPGCYFCNDVVAPVDSMSDRTLDQQCTVTRPGGAAIASALLVEIMVSVLQHKDGALAPGAVPGAEQKSDHPLGIVPHQIRGFLSTFENMVISGKSYDCCSACSDKITGAYLEQGWDFVKRALSERGYVEELSGLTEIQRAAEKAAEDIEWDESEGEIEDEGEGEML